MKISTLHNNKGKALLPQLRFPEFQEEIKEKKFGKVVQSSIYGPRFNANDYSDIGNVKTIRGTDLGSDGEIKYDQVPLALLDEKMINTHKLLEGDIVMITTAECGATGVFRKQDVDFLSSAYGVRLRLNELGYPYYFKFFFQTHQAKKEINSYIRKSTIANLPGSDILRIKINLPILPEQQKIASFLSAVDEKIQQLSRKKVLLEQYKKGVMQQLFSGKLRFKDESGKDYADWERGSFSKFIKLYRGSSPRPIIKYTTTSEDGVNWIKIGDTKHSKNYRISSVSEKITKEGALKSRSVERGEIILANSMSFGKSYLLEIEGCIYDGWFVLRKYEKSYNKEFLLQLLNSEFLQRQYFRLSTGGVVQNISSDIVYSTLLFRPVIEEQQKIANFLSNIDIKIENTNQEINQMQNFKKGLLQQMFV